MSVLDVKSLFKRFMTTDEQIEVLKGIDMQVQPGEWVALMGSSGSGKTTLLRCVSGLDKKYDGDVMLLDREVRSISPVEMSEMRRMEFGFIFQEYNLIDSLTTMQNVALPLLFDNQKDWEIRAEEAIDSLGIAYMKNRLARSLSGGEKQRAAIARSLAIKPKIVFADEPTGALDRQSSQRVLEAFATLSRANTAILMVTHDILVAARADRVLILDDGRIAKEILDPSEETIAQAIIEVTDYATEAV